MIELPDGFHFLLEPGNQFLPADVIGRQDFQGNRLVESGVHGPIDDPHTAPPNLFQQFEHNFGHGRQHLSVVFAMLMMLAFLVDQAQQLCCTLFRAVWNKYGSKRAPWEKLRSHFCHFVFQSMEHLYEVMLHDLAKELPAPMPDTS
jgi:hypothetical protein